MKKLRLGILISGRGSNMEAIVRAAQTPDYPLEVACVVANKAEAQGLKFAADHGIAAHCISHKNFPRREDFDAALHDYLKSQNLDVIACAGFMRVMTEVIIKPWEGCMLNIHPSLLPLYKGLHTHERAIADGQKEAGCTVHLVTTALDGGPILAQARVPILQNDTADDLAARVLIEEHKIYPKTLAAFAKAQMGSSS